MNDVKRRICFFLLFLSFLLPITCCLSRKSENPNVIVVIIDTLRSDRIGCYGYKGVRTESIDRLAKEGMTFTEAVCQVPLTLPSHCSIFTGRYPTAHGVRHNGLFKLDQNEVTLAEILREKGFETAAFIGAYVLNSGFGLEQGFSTYDDITIDTRVHTSMQKMIEAERAAEKVNEQFFHWLATVKGKRFFAWVHYYDPHFPYEPPSWTTKRIEGNGYDREVNYADQCLGDLLAKLREFNLMDNSIILFASDHGEALGEHSESGHGFFIYDNTIRIPLIIRAPGIVPAGEKYIGLFETVDIMPTILGLLNIEIPSSVQGKNLASEITGRLKQQGKSEAYAETYLPMLEFGWSELMSIRKGGKKFIEAPIPELYDLLEDPGELVNLYAASQEESGEMKNAFTEMLSKISLDEADPYAIQQLDEENIRILKSLGYLSGSYFKEGAMKEGLERIDPKLAIDELNLFSTGMRMGSMGRFNAAIEIFRKVMLKNPKNYKARMVIIKLLIAKEDVKEALREAEEAAQIAYNDPTAMLGFGPDLWNLYGSLLEKKGDTRGAIDAYMQGFSINPNKKIAFTRCADILLSINDFESVLSLLNETLAEDPDNILAQAYLFRTFLEMKNEEEAERIAQAMVHHDLSEHPDILPRIAKLLYEKNMLSDAALAYEQIVRNGSRDTQASTRLGEIYIALGELDKASARLDYALSLDPGNVKAYFLLGRIDLEKNNERAARTKFEKVLSMDETFSAVHSTLGTWLKERGRDEEALKEFEKALTMDPSDAVASEAVKDMQRSSSSH